jgi:hypothetical protein
MDLGEEPGHNEEGVVRSVVSMGNDVIESLCANDVSLIGRVSVADASLSLSLSLGLPAPRRYAHSPGGKPGLALPGYGGGCREAADRTARHAAVLARGHQLSRLLHACARMCA